MRISSRLFYALGRAGCRVLGDIDGMPFVKLLDFTGTQTMEELRQYLCAVRERREEYVPNFRRIRYPPQFGEFNVPPKARAISPFSIPMSVRLQKALLKLGVRRFGDLHGMPMMDFYTVRNSGRKSFEEICSLIERAAAGEFDSLLDVKSRKNRASKPVK